MDEQRRRITEDLPGMLDGEVACDPLTVAMYASDGSLYQITPLGVAFPKHRDDVVTLANYAAASNTPLIARGAGSGDVGQALGSGLVVDFSRHMHQIESIEEDRVRVQPGVVCGQLNRRLREFGRYFPPNPSNASITTIGGMLAVDAAGFRSVRVGSTRDHVASLELVLAGGCWLECGQESLDILKSPPLPLTENPFSQEPDVQTAAPAMKRMIVSKLAKLLSDNEHLIREHQPPLLRNCCGYHLRGIRDETHVHLARMLVGSEGTLGLFTAATLLTSRLPEHRGVVLLLFGRLQSAIDAVQAIAQQQPSACDLLDRRILTVAREADPRFEAMIAPAAEAALIVEQTGFSAAQARDRIRMVVQQVRSLGGNPIVAHEVYSFEEVEFLWSLPGTVVPLLTRLSGPTRPLPFVEDIAVPPEALNDFLVRAQRVFQKHEVTASLYAHAAAGQLHLRPLLPPPTAEDAGRIEGLAEDLYEIVFAVGGTISGEHGDGLARTGFVRRQYGPLYGVFQQVKEIFDPHNLLNPGKILGDDPHLMVQNLRPVVPASERIGELQLRWDTGGFEREAAACNGCAVCRTQQADLRMCPFFRLDQNEANSPRAKANVMRHYVSGAISEQDSTSPEMKRLASLCFNCKQCLLECPSKVNIPQLLTEAKAAYVQANGMNRADWILSRVHLLAVLGCAMTPLSNWLLRNGVARWILERLAGIHRLRKLPAFASRPFLDSPGAARLAAKSPTSTKRSVVYFVDYFANYHDPELGAALVAVLNHNNVTVHVPPGQTVSGMAMISAGDLDAARKLAERNVRELAEFAREGVPIVCSEPAAALCLKHEYPMLLDHPDVEVVATQAIEIGAYLEQLRRKGELQTDLCPLDLDVGYHTPCHLKALNAGRPLYNLLNLIPDLRVHRIEAGCSGMAGAYGMTKDNFATSIQIGWDLIARMRGDDLDAGTTECSSCKAQMEQGVSIPTLHPLKLLTLSYGLMPEIADRLKTTKKRTVDA